MEKWTDLKTTIKNLGFEIIVERRFKDKYGKIPEFIIAAHREKYLLLSATSWIGSQEETVNECHIYGTLEEPAEFGEREWDTLFLVNTGSTPFGQYFEIEGLDRIWKITQLEQVFKFIKWNDPSRFLWLIDYGQDHDTWEEERDKFLSSAPDWVKDFILPDEEHAKLLAQKNQ